MKPNEPIKVKLLAALRTTGRWIARLSYDNLMKSVPAGTLFLLGAGLLVLTHTLWPILDPSQMLLVAGRPQWAGSLAIVVTWFGVSLAFQGWGKWLRDSRIRERRKSTDPIGGIEGAVMTVSIMARWGMWLWLVLVVFAHLLNLFR